MRPRLPLCLLPIVGAMTFFASLSTSEARQYTIKNYFAANSMGNWDQLFAYGFNLANNRDGISTNNALQDANNTFTFNVNDYDGFTCAHAGGGTFLAYRNPIVLSSKGGNSATAGNYGNTIKLGSGTLSIKSSWSGTNPIDTTDGHGIPGYRGGQWTYVSQMGFKSLDNASNSNISVDFSDNKAGGSQYLVISSKGANQDLTIGSVVGAADGGATMLLAANPDVQDDTDAAPANVDISGSFRINGSNTTVVYADGDGYFKVGNSENNTLSVTGGGMLVFKNATHVLINATTDIDGGFVAVEGADGLYSGGYQGGGASGGTERGVSFNTVNVKNAGGLRVFLNGVVIRKDLNVLSGGSVMFLGNDFIVSGATNVSGYMEHGYVKSQLYIDENSNGGIFGGKVTIDSFATLTVNGKDVQFRNGLEIKDNGIFRLGGTVEREEFTYNGNTYRGLTLVDDVLLPESDTPYDPVASMNNLTINNGLTFGKDARVEVNVFNQTYLNGQLNDFVFNNDAYFALVKPTEAIRHVTGNDWDNATYTYERVTFPGNAAYAGGITLQNNATLTFTYSANTYFDAVDTSKDGNYEFAGVISGEGNVNLLAFSSKHKFAVSGANTYTGNTKITAGILEIFQENLAGGSVVSGSLGAGTGKVVFVNDPERNSLPAIGLNNEFNGTTDWVDQAELHRDFVIGDQAGAAAGLIIAGNYRVMNETGTSEIIHPFASNVVIYGNISDGSSAAGNLAKGGDGRLTLDGNLTYSGGTYINDGTLILVRDGSLTKSTIAFNEKGSLLNSPTVTSIIPTLELGPNMTRLDNNIQMTQHGRIDTTNVTGTATLGGLIFVPESTSVLNTYLELYTDKTDGVINLAGGVSVGESEIAFFGKELIISSQVYGTETVFDLSGKAATTKDASGVFYSDVFDEAYGAADIIFDTTTATQDNGAGGKCYLFQAKVEGANNFIKTGKNDLILATDMSNGSSYTGATTVEDGGLIMYGDGRLYEGTTLVVTRNLGTGQHGTFILNGTDQAISTLLGNGSVDTSNGTLSMNGAHGAGAYYEGNFQGNGTLAINNVFNMSGLPVGDPDRLPEDDFTGTYLVNENGVFTTLESDILSANAELNLAGGNAKVVLTGTNQNINELNSDQPGATVEFGTGAGAVTGLVIGTLYNEEQDGVPTGVGVYQGLIEGEGYLVKQGSGEFSLLNSTLNYSGDTTVKEGTLKLDRVNLVNSDMDVQKYGTLFVDVNEGDTSLGNILLSGTLEMAGSANDFNVVHMTLDGATMKLSSAITGFDSATGYNQAVVSAVNISGIVDFKAMSEINTFELTLDPGNWGRQNGTHLEIFRANLQYIDDIDKYFQVTNDYVFLNLEMSKEGFGANDTMVTVDVTRNKKVTFESVTDHSFAPILDDADVQYRATGAIGGQSDSMLSRIMDQFYVMRNEDDVRKGVETMSGSSTYILPTVELEEFRRHVNVVRNRVSTLGIRAPKKELRDEEYNAWALVLGSHSSMSSDGPVTGYDKDTWGGMIGFDTAESTELSWGMSFSYTNSDIDVKNGDSATLDNYFIDGFARYQENEWSFMGIATLGLGSGDTERHVQVGDISGLTRGSSDSVMFSLYGEAGYDILLQNNWIVQPFANLTLGYYENDGYSETGMGDAGLKVDSTDEFVTRIGAGARGIHFFQADAYEQVGRLEVRALVTQDLTDVSPDVSVGLVNGGTRQVSVPGSGVGKTAFEIGAGIQIPVAYNFYVFGDVSAEFRTKQSAVYGNIGVRMTF